MKSGTFWNCLKCFAQGYRLEDFGASASNCKTFHSSRSTRGGGVVLGAYRYVLLTIPNNRPLRITISNRPPRTQPLSLRRQCRRNYTFWLVTSTLDRIESPRRGAAGNNWPNALPTRWEILSEQTPLIQPPSSVREAWNCFISST